MREIIQYVYVRIRNKTGPGTGAKDERQEAKAKRKRVGGLPGGAGTPLARGKRAGRL